eukprot:TRINITY_DN35801_c0_g1_i1.p1 TRINITY_DN35801_c0_g1~~TRINITY_DN35801_c0_g1_i1.p1  ORF type:complete len:469 (+),score=111.89 TRINITY_DN35801_c0_g1_i1:110-1516(+)
MRSGTKRSARNAYAGAGAAAALAGCGSLVSLVMLLGSDAPAKAVTPEPQVDDVIAEAPVAATVRTKEPTAAPNNTAAWLSWDKRKCGLIDRYCAIPGRPSYVCNPLKDGKCGTACQTRWNKPPAGGLAWEDAAECARSFAEASGQEVPAKGLVAEGSRLETPDFPMAIVRVAHKCWTERGVRRPKYTVRGSGARVTCYGPRHTRFAKLSHSLMFVWASPVSDMISRILLSERHYDPKLHSLTRAALDRRPGVVADVGSNLGVVTMFAAQMGHTVFSFDATPWTRHKVQLSRAVSQFASKIKVVSAAVGSKPGKAKLNIVRDNFGGNNIVGEADGAADGNPQEGGFVTVPVVTLDDVLLPHQPFFLKVDIEGHEIEALKGARRLLTEVRPQLVVETCIFDNCNPAGLMSLMQSFNYTCGYDMNSAVRGWDTHAVFHPESRADNAPNVFCLYNPRKAHLPFRTGTPAPGG